MLVTIRFAEPNGDLPQMILGGEAERHEEFWFGQGLAFSEAGVGKGAGEGTSALHFSLLVDTVRIVSRTRRRDRETRFGVGYCDAYAYTASGLMALFVARVLSSVRGSLGEGNLRVSLSSYPATPHAEAIAKRLLAPLGYAVVLDGRTLTFSGERNLGLALRELPALFLALDRRTRLFLSEEERVEIRGPKPSWISQHPSPRAIELALQGKPTPLRVFSPETTQSAEKNDASTECELLAGNVETSLVGTVSFSEAQRAFALKMFSRMNVDRRWLLYLPGAVASVQAMMEREELERPEDAVTYYRDERIRKAIVEEKHMGSRGIVVLCRSSEVAQNRFGVHSEFPGSAFTRNGRRFFPEEDTEAVFLHHLNETLSRANFWKRFSTDWVCFDGEILPWAFKASDSSEESDLVEAGSAAISETMNALDRCESSSALCKEWRRRLELERLAIGKYDTVFKHYRTEAVNLAALKFAPFHLLATEGRTYFDRSHLWHMQVISKIARSGGGFVIPTRYEVVETREKTAWEKTLRWWEKLSSESAEGLVIKPLPFVPRGRRGLAQPALKCRSKEHLRLVYGQHYDSREARELLLNRSALKHRRSKHRRILRQFALSMEAVERFVKRSPMSAVHECVLGVLAQEVAPTMST